MSDSLNIENLLQTGYFTTGRARSAKPSSPQRRRTPSPEHVSYRRRPLSQTFDTRSQIDAPSTFPRSQPPAPFVEDEVVSLAREHGSSRPVEYPDELPHSRGDVDQETVILDVHEFNPERRFVFVPGSGGSNSSEQENNGKNERGTERQPQRHKDGQDDDRSSRKPFVQTAESRLNVEESRPKFERRRSRQDLPRLETEQALPAHHRSKSFANGTKPDYFSSSNGSRFFGDQMLSPDVIVQGSSFREKPYRGYSQAQTARPRSPSQNNQFPPSDRAYDEKRARRVSMSNPARRSTSQVDSNRNRRQVSNDRESRRRDQQSSRNYAREDLRQYNRGDGDGLRPTTPNRSRDTSRPHEQYEGRDQSFSGLPIRASAISFEDRGSVAGSEKGSESGRSDRSRSNIRTSPLPSPNRSGFGVDAAKPRNSATVRATADGVTPSANDRQSATLPYPDDHDFSMRRPVTPNGTRVSVVPSLAVASSDLASETAQIIPPPTSQMRDDQGPEAVQAQQSWQPPKFDPLKDGCRDEEQIGTFRRYSQSNEKDGPQQLPECPRTRPVAGKVDWLTLHRTNFNICPDCYYGVFYRSEYRTQFQPMLRPAHEAISCDFGSSPWYRIAWLLTLKHQLQDLNMFREIAAKRSAAHQQSCPGDRKASRQWLTVRDPSTKQCAADFSICPQCADTVYALLPNLQGTFTPITSRSEGARRSCALHFSPKSEQFVLYFDAMEIASDKAATDGSMPDLGRLATGLQRLRVAELSKQCNEDNPVVDRHWYTMQFLPQFTVCGECFDQVVRPKLDDRSIIPRNFYQQPTQLSSATCQLYSERMRAVFKKACRMDDPHYLKRKVSERRSIEEDIRNQLISLERQRRSDAYTDRQVEKLVEEWKRWE